MPVRPTPSFLEKECRKYGFPPLVPLNGEPGPAQLSYLDLLRARRTAKTKGRILPDAVAEFQGRPLLYLLDGAMMSASGTQIRDLQLLLANRSEHAWVAVVQPGQMTVYPINLDPAQVDSTKAEIITVADPRCPLFFQSLASSTHSLRGMPPESDYVFDKIHDLLRGGSAELTGPQSAPLTPLEVLSTMGRALFFRFLHDREIIRPDDLSEICPAASSGDLLDVFSNASKAASTSAWLDETFNGDLLPLVDAVNPGTPRMQRRKEYLAFYEAAGKATGGRLFAHLEAILRGWDDVGGSSFQYTIDWNDLNFAHIPVGVLSQVYETFSHQWDAPNAEETSVHYTPRKIAQIVVTESLSQIKHPEKARVLDAACGGGVFLVVALRELVRLRWIADGRRPGKDVIHKILYGQLCGFDVSEHALRLAALGLYITAIELNSIHRPPSLHKAPKPLKGTVLHNFDDPTAHTGGHRRFVMGSLGSGPSAEFDRTFDVVFGNPPWTPLTSVGERAEEIAADKARIKVLNKQFTDIGRTVLVARGLTSLAKTYQNPNNAPDVPFIWRAMIWAKPGGLIALTLDARLLLMPAHTYRDAREALVQACTVTGILNGSCLEKTAVWPGIDKPFIAFFARNEKPPDGHSFYLATPLRDTPLSRRGEFRIDYTAVQSVPICDLLRRGWLLKALTVGTSLDVEIVSRLETCFAGNTVRKTWVPPLFGGRGFSLKPRGSGDAVEWLLNLPVFRPPSSPTLDESADPPTFRDLYGKRAPHQTCPEEIYRAPLLLIPQAPGEDRSTPKSFFIPDQSFCYEQSYYGYSGGKHPNGRICLLLLHLIVHSELFRYWCLVRSSRIGATWRTFIKGDLDSFPFPGMTQITDALRSEIEYLALSLEHGIPKDWTPIDAFVNNLYGLTDSADTEVIHETVTYRSQYSISRLRAESPPDKPEVDAFCERLRSLLQPLFTLTQQDLEVNPLPSVSDDSGTWIPPWRFASIRLAGWSQSETVSILARIMREASKTSASRIIVRVPGGGILLGLLNQRRFWTYSRARLCAVEVAREHSDWFPVPDDASRARRS